MISSELGDFFVSGGVYAPPDKPQMRLFGYEQVAKADCEYLLPHKKIKKESE